MQKRASFIIGVKTSLPLVFSAMFFGLIFGFTGASGGLSLFLVSAMSYIIFAGSAQFIALLLIIEGDPFFGILIASVIINLRHMLYGIALHDMLEPGKQKLLFSYLLTDEAFLVTTLVKKQIEKDKTLQYRMDFILFGAGITLWVGWNISTILGYLLYSQSSDLINLPENFVIAASFFGFLMETILNFPEERFNILITSLFAFSISFFIPGSLTLILIMGFGGLFAVFLEYRRIRRDGNG